MSDLPTIDDTMGALLSGVIVSGILWGVSVIQTYNYYSNCAKDPLYLKLLVGTVFVMEGTHQGLISYAIYSYLVKNYANPPHLLTVERTLVANIVFVAITAVLVQSFFILRIWRLGGRRLYIVIPIGLMVFAGFGSAIAYAVDCASINNGLELSRFDVLAHMMNVLAVVTDVSIAVSLCLILHRSKTGFRKSDNIINKLIVFSVNTGVLTSTCAVISLITNLSNPKSYIFICFFFLIGRLYANSFLATLNARQRFREDMGTEVNSTIPLSHLATSDPKFAVNLSVQTQIEYEPREKSGDRTAVNDSVGSGYGSGCVENV